MKQRIIVTTSTTHRDNKMKQFKKIKAAPIKAKKGDLLKHFSSDDNGLERIMSAKVMSWGKKQAIILFTDLTKPDGEFVKFDCLDGEMYTLRDGFLVFYEYSKSYFTNK